MGPEIHDGREAKIVVKRLWVGIGMLKAIFLKAQRERTGERFFFLESTKIIIKRMLVEIWMLKSNLVKFQMKMRNIFWKLEER